MTGCAAACPRCAGPLAVPDSAHGADALPDGLGECPEHGAVPPMWRPPSASYETLVEQVRRAPALPTWLPWPLAPGWSVTDLAVAGGPGDVRATMVGCTGAGERDGSTDLLVVVEQPGTGLGAARAGLEAATPPAHLFDGPSDARLRAGGAVVRLWSVPVADGSSGPVGGSVGPVPDSPAALLEPPDPLEAAAVDRSVLVGEAGGAWLWLMVRPASALLMLGDGLQLADARDLGPALMEVEFSGPPPVW